MSLSLKDAIDAYEKDLIQDASRPRAATGEGRAQLAQHDRPHHELQGRYLGIDWRRFKK